MPNLITNLVAFYRCEESAGSNLTDAHTGAKTFTQQNSPGSDVGKVGNGRTGNGTNQYFTRAHDADFYPGTTPFWASAWVNISTGPGSSKGIISKYTGTAGWTLRIGSTNRPNFTVRNSGVVLSQINHTTVLSTSTWYFLAGGWDGTHSWISINAGEPEFSTDSSTITDTGAAIVIGRVTGSTDYIAGTLDNVGLWIGDQPTSRQLYYLYNDGDGIDYSSLDFDLENPSSQQYYGRDGYVSKNLERVLDPYFNKLLPTKNSVFA